MSEELGLVQLEEDRAESSIGRGWVAAVLAWCVPGAGHLFLGLHWRALIYSVTVVSMFLGGILLDGRFFVVEPSSPLSVLAVFSHFGTGLPYLIMRFFGPEVGNILSPTSEHGTTFLLTAGMMNLLLALDAHDIGVGRKP